MKKWRWIFRIVIWIPFAILVYRTLTGNLGAQPTETLNRELGETALRLFLLNLYFGVLIALWRPLPSWARWVPLERRFLGITTFIYVAFHIALYFIKEGDYPHALDEIFKRSYLIAGAIAASILFLMFATSNNLSVRALGYPKWKILHRFSYLALGLIALHRLLIEKADFGEALLYFVPITAMEAWRLVKSRA